MAQEIRVVILGKTGSGKSSTGNLLLGRDAFTVGAGINSSNAKCQWALTYKPDHVLKVTDTPGLCDTRRSENDVLKEIGKGVAVTLPGPHVILMVLSAIHRFTEEEYSVYKTFKELFGENITNHMIVVFVGIDCFGGNTLDTQRSVLNDQVKRRADLGNLLKDARNRYLGISNIAKEADRRKQADELISNIKMLVNENHGNCYRPINNMFHDIESLVYEIGGPTNDIIQAIINEKVKPDFWKKLNEIMQRYLIPAIKFTCKAVAFAGTMAALIALCSIM